MGEHISLCRDKGEHQKLSRYLAEYTQKVRRLVTEKGGYLVYAGGDDVLAFFPADCALTASDALATTYRQQFESWKEHHYKDDQPFPFTVSAGIAFAHHLHPLDAALETARQAEKRAKNKYGRNALGVAVLRRSGETLEVGGKWEGESPKLAPNTISWVNQLIVHLQEEKLSSRFPYSVFKEAAVITTLEDKHGRKATLHRLLKRHQQTKDLDKEIASKLIQVWVDWTEAHDHWAPALPETPDKRDQGFAELARWFVLAGWLAQGGEA